VPHLLGLIGTLIVFAGLDLLWQSRKEFVYWLRTWIRLFRSALRQPGAPPLSLALASTARERQSTLRILVGMGLVFFLGPVLIVLGLTL
jgi:hypothetical protein